MKPFPLIPLLPAPLLRSIGDRLLAAARGLAFSLLAILLGSGFLSLPVALAAPVAPAIVPATPAVLPFLKGVFTGSAPELGLTEGQLQPCPDSPNCVVSQTVDPADAEHAIAPLTYSSDRDTAHQVLLQVLSVVPGAAVVADQPDYIRAEFTSKLMGFVDDGEFYFPEETGVIQVRSASRIGESDLGVNRRRIEQIRLALADLGL